MAVDAQRCGGSHYHCKSLLPKWMTASTICVRPKLSTSQRIPTRRCRTMNRAATHAVQPRCRSRSAAQRSAAAFASMIASIHGRSSLSVDVKEVSVSLFTATWTPKPYKRCLHQRLGIQQKEKRMDQTVLFLVDAISCPI